MENLIRVHIPLHLRLMAAICGICPCCVIARRWPNSRFAKKFKKVQHLCPFCRSRVKVMHIRVQAEHESEQAVSVNTRTPTGSAS